MTNGHDRGLRGVPLRTNHAAEDARHRRLGCACLVAIIIIVVAVLCGVGLASAWM